MDYIRSRLAVGRALSKDGCLVWTGCVSTAGYGIIRTSYPDGVWRNKYAHRLSYEASRGAIPDGLTIDHLCRNRACVNPAHLDVVTHRENILRGFGRCAINARKTTCPKGHPFDSEYRGERGCSVCARENSARYRAKKKSAARVTQIR